MEENTLGKNIRYIRKSFKLSQYEFAEKLGVSRSTIQHWEMGYSIPDIPAIIKIKKIFNVSYDEIIDGI